MARVSNRSKLTQLQSQVRASQKWRDHEKYAETWKRLVNLYKGRHYKTEVQSDRAVINTAFSTKNIIAPSVAVNNPKFAVNARRPEAADQATVTEQVLNYLWRTYKYQREFRLAVDDMLTVGHGWVKVGYKATKPPEARKALEDADDEEAEAEGIDDRDETVEGNVESELYMAWDDDRPFVERVSFFDMFVDPNARHPKEMKWIAQRTRRLVTDVRVDSRYEKATREKVNGAMRNAHDYEEQDGRNDEDMPDDRTVTWVDVYEFYDLRRQEVSTFTLDSNEGEFLIKPKRFPYPFGHPFVMLRDYEVIDTFYPMGELEAIEILQQELNQTRTQMLTHRAKYARKYLYHEDSFDDTGIKALKSATDNEMVPFGGDIQEMQHAVVAMPVQPTPADFYNQTEMIQADIDRTTGVSDYMRGTQANIRRTATEAAMIQDAQNARAADKLAYIEGALSEIGERLIQLMQLYMRGEHVVRIVGLASPAWVKFDADYIQGQFDYEVEAGSTQPMNESFRQQQALQLVDAMAGLMQMGAQIDPNMLAMRVLRSFGVKDPDSYLGGGPQVGPDGQPVNGPQGGPSPAPPSAAPAPEGMEPESPIEGIPAGLVNQLMGASGLDPRSM